MFIVSDFITETLKNQVIIVTRLLTKLSNVCYDVFKEITTMEIDEEELDIISVKLEAMATLIWGCKGDVLRENTYWGLGMILDGLHDELDRLAKPEPAK
jgi:hypothetical protein